MKISPQLSVIIPTYNRAATLKKAVESVLHQTLAHYEIIVVDDGSTDRTENTLADLLKEKPVLEGRLRYFFQRNQGKSVALNYGLSHARGEWIAFLDSDDLWLPNKTEEQFQAIHKYAPLSEACFTDARFVNNPAFQATAFERAGKRYHDKTGVVASLNEFLANPFGIFMQTLITHSRVMRKVGEFDPTLWVIQDIDFIFRVALETRLCFVNAPLALIDRTPQRSEGLIELLLENDKRSLSEQQRMLEKWLRLCTGYGADVQKSVRSHLRGIHSQWASWFLTNKKYREARQAISEAARVELTPGIAAKWFLATIVPPLARNIVMRRSRHRHEQGDLVAMTRSQAQDGISHSMTGREI